MKVGSTAPAGECVDMSAPEHLLDAVLDSWDRNNTILLNLLRALPEGGLEARAIESSPSIAELFTHIHYVRLVFVFEDAPEFARHVPEDEWVIERDRRRIAEMLSESATAVRAAVRAGWRQAGTWTCTTITRFFCFSTCSGTRATITDR
jgi:hypothetical protein